MPEYIGVIGLEVHVQLKTKSKLFCFCDASYGGEPNTRVCPVCLGMPGALPVLNKEAVEYALKLITAVGATVNPESEFARKNYFYPDLPKGYQISQFEKPLARGGSVTINDRGGNSKSIRISEIHLEEEAGKSHHDIDNQNTYLDFNRCGVPLIEIVTHPDMNNGSEADAFLHKLKQIAQYLDITTGNMQEGAMRWDVNVSVRRVDITSLNPRHEIKNMNSFRFARKAIDYEIEKQIDTFKSGGTLTQQTMLWDESRGITEAMREKEMAADYRYFPEPDLRPLVIDQDWLEKVKINLPELPDKKLDKFVEKYGLKSDQALNLVASRQLADYYESVTVITEEPSMTANWIINEIPSEFKDDLTIIYKIPAENLAELINSIKDGTISTASGKNVLAEMLQTGESASSIINKKNLAQISDEESIKPVIEKVLSANVDNVKMYFSGKTGLFGYFVGRIMKETSGKANPKIVNKLLTEALNKIKGNDA